MASDDQEITDLVGTALSKGTKVPPETIVELRRRVTVEGVLPYLKDALTSENSKDVNIAVYVLSQVAQHRDDVDAATLTNLLQFFIGKAREYSCSDTAVEAVATLMRDYGVVANDACAELLLHELLPHVHTQAMLLSTKRHVYSLLEALLCDARLRAPVLGAGALLPRLFLSAIDGERDPELVLKAFLLHRTVTSTFDATALTFLREDLFEAVSAYFPVLFTPPANCPVTRDDLKLALHEAMAAPLFHEQCIPFLCSKLTSPAASVKTDTFVVLQMTFRETPLELLEPHFHAALTAVRGEVLKLTAMQEQNPDIRPILQDALTVLTQVGVRIGELQQSSKGGAMATAVLSAAHPIVDTAINNIDTDSPSARAYATMIYALCSASASTAAAIGAYLVPSVLQLAAVKESSDRRMSSCVSCLGALLTACEGLFANATGPGSAVPADVEGGEPSAPRDAIAPLRQFDSRVASATLELLLRALHTSASTTSSAPYSAYTTRVCVDSAATLIALGTQGAWISKVEQRKAYTAIWDVIRSRAVDDEVRDGAITALRNVARVDGAHERCAIADIFASTEATTACAEDEVVRGAAIRLVTALVVDDETAAWALRQLALGPALGLRGVDGLRAVKTTALSAGVGEQVAAVAAATWSRLWDATASVSYDTAELMELIEAAGAVAAACDAKEQAKILRDVALPPLFRSEGVVIGATALQAPDSLIARMAGVSIAAIASASPEVLSEVIVQPSLGALSQLFVHCCGEADGVVAPWVSAAALRALTAFTNKVGATATATTASAALHPRVAAAIAKGLIVRDDHAGDQYVQRVVDALQEEDSAARVAAVEAMGILAAPTHALRTSRMWQQRFFHTALALLKPLAQSTDASVAGQIAAYDAVAAMVAVVPQKLLKIASEPLLVFVRGALEKDDSIESGAAIFSALFAADEEAILDYVSANPRTIVSLASAGARFDVRLAARKAALEIVATIGQMATHDTEIVPVLLPLKQEVLSKVVPALGDKKRVVRQAAGRCRHYWSLVE